LRDVIFCNRSSVRRFWCIVSSKFLNCDSVIIHIVFSINCSNFTDRRESLHCVLSRIRDSHSSNSFSTFLHVWDSIRDDKDKEDSFVSSFINSSCNI
jgi:hypothetical protein